jgi:hypothetical protein
MNLQCSSDIEGKFSPGTCVVCEFLCLKIVITRVSVHTDAS